MDKIWQIIWLTLFFFIGLGLGALLLRQVVLMCRCSFRYLRKMQAERLMKEENIRLIRGQTQGTIGRNILLLIIFPLLTGLFSQPANVQAMLVGLLLGFLLSRGITGTSPNRRKNYLQFLSQNQGYLKDKTYFAAQQKQE